MKKSIKNTKSISVKKIRTLAGMAVIATALTSGASNAALILHEGFDYTPGASIGGANGGTGWSGGWVKTGSGTAAVEAQDINVPSTALAGIGGQANLTSIGVAGGGSVIERTLATTIGNNATETYWFSFRLRRDDAVNESSGENSTFLKLSDSSNNVVVSVGQTSIEQRTISFGGATPVVAGGFIDIGQNYFALVRLGLNPTGTLDTLDVRYYREIDSLPSSAPTTFNLSQSFDNSISISKLTIDSSRNAGTLHVDEIRMGTTYADVIPEPSSCALSGIAVAMMLLRRRRA